MKKLLYLIPFIIWSCSGTETGETDINSENSNNTNSNSNKLTVYSVPSPAFVTAVLKNAGINYSDNLLDETRNSESVFGVSSKKFMNLGIYIVDFNYAYMYEQQPTAYIYLDKIDKILKELQLNNPKINRIIVEFKENKENKDSVKVYLNGLQSEINNYLIGSNSEANGFYLLTGMYVEGIYLTLSTFPNSTFSKNNQIKPPRELSQLLVQHQVQLKNIISLFDNISENRPDDFLRDLGKLKDKMEKLKISYHINKSSGQIEKVNFDKSQLKEFNAEVNRIRKEIIKN